MDRWHIEHLDTRFRRALERYLELHPRVNLGTNLNDPTRDRFPLDCCKAASFMFGEYLSLTEGAESLSYVWGLRDGASPGWLLYQELFIDLTPDQFTDQTDPIIVLPVDSSPWHDTFSNQQTHPLSLKRSHPFVRYTSGVIDVLTEFGH